MHDDPLERAFQQDAGFQVNPDRLVVINEHQLWARPGLCAFGAATGGACPNPQVITVQFSVDPDDPRPTNLGYCRGHGELATEMLSAINVQVVNPWS